MTDAPSPPSIDPASREDAVGMLRLIMTKFLQGVDDMLPAKVIAYDRTTNRAQVQPLISVVTTDKKVVQRAQVASIPVLQLGGGGFVLSFPIKAGDIGWIKANDRDISLFLQSLPVAGASPNSDRKHSFEDAMFIPDTMFKQVVINGDDTENVVLQSIDGTVRISLGNDKITVTAPEVIVNSPQVTVNATDVDVSATDVSVTTTTAEVVASSTASVNSPAITMTASTSITLDTPSVVITGDFHANSPGAVARFGGVEAADNILAGGDVFAGPGVPKSLLGHRHSGVTVGGSNTGLPV